MKLWIVTKLPLLGLSVLALAVASPSYARKSLLVDLSKSTVYAMDDGKVVRSLVINPGDGDTPTRPGQYKITQKVRQGYRSNLVDIHNRPLKKGALGAPMDYWMRLGGTGMGFHRSSLWKPDGRWGSHGCLRMSRAGARWLFDWAPLGTPVKVLKSGAGLASAVRHPSRKTASHASKASGALASSRSRAKKATAAHKPAATVTTKKTVTAKKPAAPKATATAKRAETAQAAKKTETAAATSKKPEPTMAPRTESAPAAAPKESPKEAPSVAPVNAVNPEEPTRP